MSNIEILSSYSQMKTWLLLIKHHNIRHDCNRNKQQFIMIVMMYLIGIHPRVMNVYPQVMSECSIQKEY